MQQKIKIKKQKILLLLPVFIAGLVGLIIAGINMAGTTHQPDNSKQNTPNALNTHLPPPNLPVKQKNKFEVYMQAARDSAKKQEAWQNDPNNKQGYDVTPPIGLKKSRSGRLYPRNAVATMQVGVATIDPNEAKVNDRIQRLYAALNASRPAEKQNPNSPGHDTQLPAGSSSPETSRLEHLLEMSHTSDTAADPNLDRADRLLDKVLQIQHPERLENGKTAASGEKKAIYDVSLSQRPGLPNSSFQDQEEETQNGFYGLDDSPDTSAPPVSSTIQAIVPETQTLQTGSTIKLRLLQEIYVNNHHIPANSFIYGICSVNSERLQVQVNNVLSGDEIIPIAVKVYDTDGLEGVFVPGAVTRDLTKEGIAQGVSGMSLASYDPSLGAQAAAAGIQTAQTLFSKKVKAVIVTIKAGHLLLLKNAHPSHA